MPRKEKVERFCGMSYTRPALVKEGRTYSTEGKVEKIFDREREGVEV